MPEAGWRASRGTPEATLFLRSLLIVLLLLAAVAAGGGPAEGRRVGLRSGASSAQAEASRVRVVQAGADTGRAAQVRRFLEGLPPLAGIPDTLPSGVTLYLAASAEAFDSLTGGGVPEWGAGVAIPALGRIVLPAFGTRRSRGWDEARVLRHEWAHLALHQYVQGLRAPRWFDEGYAEWASGGWSPSEGWRLRVAFALGRAPPLDSLALDWPRDRASAELAYLLSATAVEYLVRESGERGLALFLRRWREAGSFPAAFQEVYGVTQGQFEEDWRRYVRKQYGWLFVFSHSSVFWLSMALLLLLLLRVRRGRDREAMARLRATEPPEAPAYWEEGREGTNGASERSPEGGEQSRKTNPPNH